MLSEGRLVSIVTPVYNIAELLEETIDSVLAQSYRNWELLLIDDKSTDHSADIIREYETEDSRIKGFYLPENRGAGYSRNIGLDNANGEYIAFLDSDDIWVPKKLEVQMSFFQSNPSVEFYCSWYSVIDSNEHAICFFSTPGKISFNLLKYNNYILTSTVICSRSFIGGLRFPLMRRRQDWVFFLDLLKKTPYAYALPEILVKYRKTKTSLSSNKWNLIKPNFDFFKSYFYKGNKTRAIFHFIIFLPFYFHNKIFNKKRMPH